MSYKHFNNMNFLNRLNFNSESKKYSKLLEINGFPLDKEQKKVCFSDKKNTLVIAGAGCGKTTTMVGKIKYLVEVKSIKPAEIMCISFTNESANSLNKSLIKNGVNGIEVLTFHKLALRFLKKCLIVDNGFLDYILQEYYWSNQYSFKKNIILEAFQKKQYSDIDVNNFIKYFRKLIFLCHCSNINISNLYQKRKVIMRYPFWKRCSLLCNLYLLMDLLSIYENEKKAIGACDFDDLIIKATNEIAHLPIDYKYLIVDEYQDTSLIRVLFLQEIIKASNAKLIVVGDDYQSIYRFNGCDLKIFLNFNKYFHKPKIFKLNRTYRNSQELLNITQKFITQNPYQIKKHLCSSKNISDPIRIVYYTNKNRKKLFSKLLLYADSNFKDYMVLGRNNFDINYYTDKPVNYLTIHKSKGLEANNIIIINLENNLYGLPSQIDNSLFEKILFNDKSLYPYDEERRLFYVALTRTKNYVVLFVNKNNPSIFIKELLKNYNIKVLSI